MVTDIFLSFFSFSSKKWRESWTFPGLTEQSARRQSAWVSRVAEPKFEGECEGNSRLFMLNLQLNSDLFNQEVLCSSDADRSSWMIHLPPLIQTCKHTVSNEYRYFHGAFWTYSGLTTVLRALVAHFSLFVVKQASALWCTSGRAVHDTLLLDRATAVECEVVNWTHFREEKIYEKRIFPRSRKPRKLGGLLKLTKEGARRLIRTNKGFSQVERLQRDDVAVFEWDRERNGCWWLSVRGVQRGVYITFFRGSGFNWR